MVRSITVCVALVVAASAPLPAQEPSLPDLGSPRATFHVFLSAMGEVKQGRSERLADAVACLDLSGVAGLVRDDAGPKLARDLKNYLDKIERIDTARLPAAVEGGRWTWRRTAAGEVSLARGEDGQWRFSRETLDSLPRLLDSVRDRDFVAGIEGGGGAAAAPGDFLRARMPRTLLRRAFLLETWQWLALLAIAFLGVVIERIVRLVLGAWLRRLLAQSARLRDRKVDASLEKPVGILVMGLIWLALLPLIDLPVRALAALAFAARLVTAGGGVWAVYRLVDVLAAHFAAVAADTETKIDDILIPMGRRALKIVVVAFGVLFVAQNLDIDITSLLAGLGIGGIAFALAAKDTVENLFGSVTVLIDRPFHIGDWVVIDDLEGTVEEIGFRSTRIRTFYDSRITVPNARLVNAAVDNLGARRYRRFKCMIGVQYDTPADRIEAFCEGIRELIRRHPYTRKDYYMVYFNQFADSSLNVLLYVFHETPDWATELRERHRLLVDVVRLAARLGVEFAFPTRTLHVASMPPSPAAGTPPASSADAVTFGRAEAEAILGEIGSGDVRPPVDFADPDRIRP